MSRSTLTDEKATRVKFYDASGKLLEDILLGKNGPGYQSSYLRRPGQDEVYLVNVLLDDNFRGATAEDWRDRKLFPDYKPEDVTRLRVDDRVNTQTFTLEKRFPDIKTAPPDSQLEEEWWITEPYESLAKRTNVDNLINALVNANAAEFAKSEDVAKASLDQPTLIASFQTRTHPSEATLTVGAEAETGRFYAKTNLSDDLYIVYKQYQLSRGPEFLKASPIPTPSPTSTPSPLPTEAPEAPEMTEAPASPDSNGAIDTQTQNGSENQNNIPQSGAQDNSSNKAMEPSPIAPGF